MLEALPNRAFFRLEIPIWYCAETPLINGDVRKWGERHLLPALCTLDGQRPFADAYMAWNEEYLFAAFLVREKSEPPQVDTASWWKKDGFRLCIDTRDARENKRATRFCRFLYMLPSGGGPERRSPIIGVHAMSRAMEPAPETDLSGARLAARYDRVQRCYSMEAAIPLSVLNGWDSVEHPRIGLFYKVKDVQHGSQNLTVGDDLGWNVDPSTWATGVLRRDGR